MSNNLNTLLLAELYTASNYVERLCHAYKCSSIKFPLSLGDNYVEELYKQLKENVFITRQGCVGRNGDNDTDRILDVTCHISEICKAMVRLDFDSVGTALKAVEIINIMYRYSYYFHVYACKTHIHPIALPTPPLADIVKTDSQEEFPITLFGLRFEKLENAFAFGKGNSLYEFQELRERRYRDMLREARRLEEQGALDEAEELLLKLCAIKEKGELWGLLARIQFSKGNNEQAKEYCLKGIRQDPDYGSLYNDLGLYWMEEGNRAEALKWFALAKQCIRYPERQDAYVNSGRIYKKQGRYFLALEQFTIALDMDPFNYEIREELEELETLAFASLDYPAAPEKIIDYYHEH